MSVNEIIKKHLPITKQKLPKSTPKINHCQAKDYKYCSECNENKFKLCNEKLILWKIKQISEIRWHLYFKCQNNHQITRWVIIDNKNVLIGYGKN